MPPGDPSERALKAAEGTPRVEQEAWYQRALQKVQSLQGLDPAVKVTMRSADDTEAVRPSYSAFSLEFFTEAHGRKNVLFTLSPGPHWQTDAYLENELEQVVRRIYTKYGRQA